MPDDLYCKVYVADAAGSAALKSVITGASGQSFERRSARIAGLTVDVFDRDGRIAAEAPDANDFVRWPVYLEIEPTEETMPRAAFIAAVAALLNTLNDRGMRTVASCDFEVELASAQQSLG